MTHLKQLAAWIATALVFSMTAGCSNNQEIETAARSSASDGGGPRGGSNHVGVSEKVRLRHTLSEFSQIDALAISPNGKTLASVSNELKFWDIDQGELLLSVPINGGIDSMAISPDGKTLVMGRWDGAIEFWDFQNAKPLALLSGHSMDVNAVLIGADSQTLISGSEDGALRIWNLSDGKLKTTLLDQRKTGQYLVSINAAALSADGKTLASCDDSTVKVWNLETSEERHSFKEREKFQGGVKFLSISADGLTLAGASSEALMVWDLNSGKEFDIDFNPSHSTSVKITSIALSPDGQTIATGLNNGKIGLWDVTSRKPIVEDIQNNRSSYSSIIFVGFLPQGKTLVSATAKGVINIWDLP